MRGKQVRTTGGAGAARPPGPRCDPGPVTRGGPGDAVPALASGRWWRLARLGAAALTAISGVRSLTLQQTIAVSAVALIALVFMAVGAGLELLERERAALVRRTDRVVAGLEAGIRTSLGSADDLAAEQVLSALVNQAEIRHARITTVSGQEFAAATRPPEPPAGWVTRSIRHLFEDRMRIAVPIEYVDHSGPTPLVFPMGTLELTLDASVVARDFVEALVADAVKLAASVAVLASAIALVVHLLLSRPLARLGNRIAEIDPDDPGHAVVAVPPWHRHNELGRLVDRTNLLLRRLGAALDEVRRMATTDALTGLPNRAGLINTISERIDRCSADARRFAVVFIDLDGFKHINDSLGHDAGDRLLRETSDRLAAAVGSAGVVSRPGGDEFVAVLEPIADEAAVIAIAERLRGALAAPFDLGGHGVRITGSSGIALFPDNGATFTALLRAADVAMYAAKAGGPGGVRFFNQDMAERAVKRLHLESALREAAELEQFVVHYQPKVEGVGHGLVGCEALLRWSRHGRLVPPGDFIPLAEATRLIVPIGEWVLRTAGLQAQAWVARGFPGRIAVNVSPAQLAEGDTFLDIVARLVADGVVKPDQIEIEVTESLFMSEVETQNRRLGQLKSLGFRIALDDFGTGYSCLAHLSNLPVDVLKIDRAFTRLVPEDPRLARLILSLNDLLGLECVAEGVETQTQAAWFTRHGCTLLQGYLFGAGMAAPEFEARYLTSAA